LSEAVDAVVAEVEAEEEVVEAVVSILIAAFARDTPSFILHAAIFDACKF
jgi:hypothetical protein